MERRVNFILIGAIFFVILVAFVGFLFFMGKLRFGDDTYENFMVKTALDVNGLNTSTLVKYKGLVIGQIADIGFDTADSGAIKMTVRIKKDVQIRKNASLIPQAQGIVGQSFLALNQDPNEPMLSKNDEKILILQPNLLSKLTSKADFVTNEIVNMLRNFSELFNKTSIAHLTQIIKNADHLSANLKQTQTDINLLLKNTNRLINQIDLQIKSGQYNVREILNPLVMRVNGTLQNMDTFFMRGTNLLDKFDKNPYDTIFGVHK